METEIENLDGIKTIHLIGIGGISMSAIAETLKSWGYNVTGSDITKSEITDKLISDGIDVTIGHDSKKVQSADLYIMLQFLKQTQKSLQLKKKIFH